MNEHKDAQTVQGGASNMNMAVFNSVVEDYAMSKFANRMHREMALIEEVTALRSANKELLEALRRIEARCPADHADYTLASIGDTARAVLAKHQEAS